MLPYMAYLSDLAASDYHLFASIGSERVEQRVGSFHDVKNWVGEWFPVKEKDFFWRGIHKVPTR